MATTSPPRVLFVTYEASRTGSPALLLRFLRHLAATSAIDPVVLCWRGGPLAEHFAALAPTVVLHPPDGRTLGEAVAVGARELGLTRLGRAVDAARLAWGRRGLGAADLVYLNGIPSFVALRHLPVDGLPVLGHVHELEFALGRSLAPEDRGLLVRPDRFVAVSGAVAQNLVDGHGIDRGRVAVCHGFVDDAVAAPTRAPTALRAELGIAPDAPVVGAVGDLIWRKGPDLFVRLGAALDAVRGADRPPVHLVWVGGAPGRGTWEETAHDAAACLGARLHLVGEQEDVASWYGLFDVFALTSREDPFPLVVLEAAQAGVPIVAFAQGGAPELLGPRPGEGSVGALVDPLDVSAMAAAVAALLDDADEAAGRADRARRRVQAECVTSVAAACLLAEIEALL